MRELSLVPGTYIANGTNKQKKKSPKNKKTKNKTPHKNIKTQQLSFPKSALIIHCQVFPRGITQTLPVKRQCKELVEQKKKFFLFLVFRAAPWHM